MQRVESPKSGPIPRPQTSELRVQARPSVKQKMQCVYKALDKSGGLNLADGDVIGIGTVSRNAARSHQEKLDHGLPLGQGPQHKPYRAPLFESDDNQDAALVMNLPGATLLAVFDGVGGVERGKLAAHLARDEVAAIASEYSGKLHSKAFLGKAMRGMQRRIAEQLFDGLGDTTATIVVIGEPNTKEDRKVMSIGAGDSLAFAITHDGSRIFQLNPDQSEMKMHVAADGSITRTNASGAPIFSSVTKPADIEIREGIVRRGDTVVLTTDGITGDIPSQYPVNGQARLLQGLALGVARDPQQLVRNALGQATKIDDRTVILFVAGGADRWPSRRFPALQSAVDHEWQSGSLDAWLADQAGFAGVELSITSL